LEYNNERCFLRSSCRDIRRAIGARVQKVVKEPVKGRLGAVSNEVRAKSEESPLLKAVIRERLVKTQQTEKSQRVL
jgi:hypothetical protein